MYAGSLLILFGQRLHSRKYTVFELNGTGKKYAGYKLNGTDKKYTAFELNGTEKNSLQFKYSFNSLES